jgi:nucleoside-diphosphate-sugar epimerase
VQARTKIAVTGATGRIGHHVADALETGGYDVVKISRSGGVDIVTADGVGEALNGVACAGVGVRPPGAMDFQPPTYSH